MTERVKNKKLKVASPLSKKEDTRHNADNLDNIISRHKQREQSKESFPLRINRNTVIYVAREKCNKEYAENYLERMKRCQTDLLRPR